MADGTTRDGGDDLAQARATIARQAAEIERLRGLVEADRSAEELREALALAAAAGTIGAPVSHDRLLELIVETAVRAIPCAAAHLFLLDEDGDEFVFAVAVGPNAAAVEQRRVPLDQGLAGLVAAGGQPMALSDVAADQNLASEVAATLGYLPRTILCVPLHFDERVIGVLELLDRRDAPAFDLRDVELLGLFADQAAVAIMQSRTHQNLAALVADVVGALRDLPDERRERLRGRAQAFAARLVEPDDVDYREALDLARLVQEIAWHGEREYAACRAILQSFARYLRSLPGSNGSGSAR